MDYFYTNKALSDGRYLCVSMSSRRVAVSSGRAGHPGELRTVYFSRKKPNWSVLAAAFIRSREGIDLTEIERLIERTGLERHRCTSHVAQTARLSEFANLEGSVSIFGDAVVGDGARLNNCIVSAKAWIGSGVQIGEGAVIGEGAILGNDAQVGRFAYIGPGVRVGRWARVGEYASLGAGCMLGSSCLIGHAASIGERAEVCERVRVQDGARIEPGSLVGPVPAKSTPAALTTGSGALSWLARACGLSAVVGRPKAVRDRVDA